MYIAIAGNIGSGKTSLTQILSEELGFVANYEDSNNPYIGDFYEDMNRWSFNLQIYFLGKRLRQVLDLLRCNENIVQDRTIFEDAHIFASNLHESGLMSTRDFQTYMQIFELSYGLVKKPDLLIYIRASVSSLISQIQKRGRSYEMSIDKEYLGRLNERYNHWIECLYEGEVMVIDVDKQDFVLSEEVRAEIVEQVKKRMERIAQTKKMDSLPLPAPFRATTENLLGTERTRRLFSALETEPPVSVRFNPFKLSEKPEGEGVPWSRYGYYLAERPVFTADPLLHGGAYYVQEAGSMFLEHVFRQVAEEDRPLRILDLCAAPGGKTTHLSSLAGLESIVVANEVIRGRANILKENVIKWGLGNTVVTNNDPQDFAGLKDHFDIVVVDAPCSGEGMFRKSPESRGEWSESNVRLCAVRQQRMLSDIWDCLRPEGCLIYSTCTFNPIENEENVRWMAENFSVEAVTVAVEKEWGIEKGEAGGIETFRFYPGETRSEGFFTAVLRKTGSGKKRPVVGKRTASVRLMPRKQASGFSDWFRQPEYMTFGTVGENRVFAYYADHAEQVNLLSEHLNVIYSGVEAGKMFGRDFRPEHSLAVFHDVRTDGVNFADLPLRETLRYLRKEEIPAELFAEGWNLVGYSGLPVGWVKKMGKRYNSLYPKEWRIRNL